MALSAVLVPVAGVGGLPQGSPGARADVVVAATTDVHGRVRGWDYFSGAGDSARGLARLSTIVDSLRNANPGRVILLDAGDLLQGNPLTDVAARRPATPVHPVIAAMNAMRYDAAVIGNHEFNYGLPFLRRTLAQARFPFLAANAYLPNGQRAWTATRMLIRAGARIAIVGATQPGAMVWDRDNLNGRLTVRDIVPEVRRAVSAARSQGADAVVVVVHSGLDDASSYDTVSSKVPSENVGARLAREVPGIDLLVLGHSHREMAGTTIGSTLVIQARNWAGSLAVATLSLERTGVKWRVTAKRSGIIPATGHAEDPRVVNAVASAHEATVAWVGRTVGFTASAWRADSSRVIDTPLIDLIQEVMRRRAGADLAVTPAFDLGASIDAGPITVAEVARLYPYENTLRAVRITGAQLRAYLEFSSRYYRTLGTPEAAASIVDASIPGYNFDIVAGADYTIDLRQPVGKRITTLTVRGLPVRDEDTFTLALNNYRQTGGGGYSMLRDAPVVYDRLEDIRGLLIDEVTRADTLRPERYFTANWKLEPAEAIATAYGAMYRPRGGERTPAVAASSPSGHLGTGRWLRILSTNDFHGALDARRDANGTLRGGASTLATEIARARAECAAAPACTAVLVDGGDEFQGTPASNFVFGKPVVELFNRLGYAAAALGNHEFDWGQDSLRARMREARYPILGANVTDSAGRDISWIPNDTIVSLGGLRVGIIGIADPRTPSTTKIANVRDLRFGDPAATINRLAPRLRARGASVVVVLAHIGAFCDRDPSGACTGEIIEVAKRVTEKVDAIISGHTHTPVNAVVNGIPIVQARNNGTALGVIDVPLSPVAEPVIALRDILPDRAAHDAAVDSLVAAANAPVTERMRQPVATIAERMAKDWDGTLGNFIADAQRAAGGGDVAVMNNGGVRAPLPAGLATYGTFFEVQPFGNVLVRITVRGRELRSYLERLVQGRVSSHLSGVVVTWDPSRPAGSRITSVVMHDGRPLDDERTYRLVLSDFLAAGGDGMNMTERALAFEDLNIVDIDALIAWARAQPQPVRAPTNQRLVSRTP